MNYCDALRRTSPTIWLHPTSTGASHAHHPFRYRFDSFRFYDRPAVNCTIFLKPLPDNRSRKLLKTGRSLLSYTPETLQRQWQTLRLIPRNPRRISASELCDRLLAEGHQVTKRTVERDLQSLSAFFPLVSDERAKPYGWCWDKDAPAFDLPGLSNSEALALLLARAHLSALLPAAILAQLHPLFRMAEHKLASLQGHLSHWMDKVRVIPPTQGLIAPRLEETIQATISDALLLGKQVQIGYLKRGAKSIETYPIHPLGLVQRGPVIYLVCTIKTYPHLRLLALHRVQSAEAIDIAIVPPPDFSLDAYIESGALGWLPGKSIQLEAAFTVEVAEHLEETPLAVDQALATLPDGRIKISATVRETLQLRWWLQGFGEAVEVLAPPELRQQMATSSRNLAARYSKEETG